LHRIERRGIRGQDRRHTGHGRPHQDLITSNHAQGRGQTATDAALSGGGDQGQVARAGNGQEQHNGRDESTVIRNTEKH